MRRDSLDALFSRYVRLRADNHCQRCGHWVEFRDLDCAHCVPRWKKSTRWDIDDALGLCGTCHDLIDNIPSEKTKLFTRYLGEEGYQSLEARAMTPQKPDRELIRLQLKKLVEEIE